MKGDSSLPRGSKKLRESSGESGVVVENARRPSRGERIVGSGYKADGTRVSSSTFSKTSGRERRGERKEQKGWREKRRIARAASSGERMGKVRDDATCPEKRSSFASLRFVRVCVCVCFSYCLNRSRIREFVC